MENKSDKCTSCKYRIAPGGWAACDGCIHDEGLKDRYEPMTNADRIRNMTDEELANYSAPGRLFARDVKISARICRDARNAGWHGSKPRQKARGRNESSDSLRGIANRVQGVPGVGA